MSDGPIAASHHHLRAMVGRDPQEPHRTATSLELLYDLTLVVAFGVAGAQLAHALAAGHLAQGLSGFFFVQYGTVWAWMGYTRFASAFDTDDWLVRAMVMIQMVGVLILALGIPPVFHGLEDHWQMDNKILVLGYVVMRLALVSLWWRAGRANPDLATTCRRNAMGIVALQVVWMIQAFAPLPTVTAWALVVALIFGELCLPYVAETRLASTTWHPHHLVERYGLLAIIALGEGIIGTSASLQALYEHYGWSVEVVIVLASGVCLTVGLWWVYFSIPFAQVLERHRGRVFAFTYPHIVIYASIAAVGAGLHVAALLVEEQSSLGVVGTVLAVVIPIAVFVAAVYSAFALVLREHGFDPFHALLLLATAAVLVIAVVLALQGASLGTCLIVATLAPWVSVIGFELLGYRHINERLAAQTR